MEFEKNDISKPIMNTNIIIARFPQPKEMYKYTLYTILGKVRKDNNKYVSAIINLNKNLINPKFGNLYNISILNIYPYGSDPKYISCIINSYLEYHQKNNPNKLILILCNDGITTSGYYLAKYLQIHNNHDNFVYIMEQIFPYFKK